jgi:sulfite oxidase
LLQRTRYRIGNLSAADAAAIEAEGEGSFGDAYGADPPRPRAAELRIPSTRPWNSEPQPAALVEAFYTPNELFFVRNHNPVPLVDESEWELEIESNASCGLAGRTYTLAELKTRFQRHEVVSVMQCAGNRQEDFVGEERPLYVALARHG